MRIFLIYYAAYLLHSGHAYGGQLELEALEDARLDAADFERAHERAQHGDVSSNARCDGDTDPASLPLIFHGPSIAFHRPSTGLPSTFHGLPSPSVAFR